MQEIGGQQPWLTTAKRITGTRKPYQYNYETDTVLLAAVEEYGITRLPGELAGRGQHRRRRAAFIQAFRRHGRREPARPERRRAGGRG